jgi:hypothetical protein
VTLQKRNDQLDFCLHSEGWGSQLAVIVKNTSTKSTLDAVIDSGGDLIDETRKVLKQGGQIVCYGMYNLFLAPKLLWH